MEFLTYGQLIIGPAGSGKSTYCKLIQDHARSIKRNIKIINLDPAADNNLYECDINIRELITVEQIMNKKKLGPNGSLIYCMDYLNSKFNWLENKINECGENNYYLIDCPGQLELFSHYPIMKTLTEKLKKLGMNIISVFCLDITFTTEFSKFISGSCISLASMIQLELPHINILTKVDLINKDKDDEAIEALREIDLKDLLKKEKNSFKNKYYFLNKSLVELIDSYSLISLIPFNIKDEESMNEVLYECDNILQYYENQEPKDEYYNNADKILEDNNEYEEINQSNHEYTEHFVEEE